MIMLLGGNTFDQMSDVMKRRSLRSLEVRSRSYRVKWPYIINLWSVVMHSKNVRPL